MKQRLITLLTVLCLVTNNMFSYDALVNNIYYNLDTSAKTAEVTQGGNDYKGDVVIPSTIVVGKSSSGLNEPVTPSETYTVTGIGSGAFENSSNLNSVTLPSSLTYIGDYAFQGCYIITSIDIPKSVVSIGVGAFDCCNPSLSDMFVRSALSSINVDRDNPAYTSVDGILYDKDATTIICYPQGLWADHFSIPETVTKIAPCAFVNSKHLTSITLPEHVTEIGYSAFRGCSNIVYMEIPSNVTRIDDGAFSGCKALVSITIPNSVETIGSWAFIDCKALTSITIPNSVTTIGRGTFYGCIALTSVVISESVTNIDAYAFQGCRSLTSISLPKSVTCIGRTSFWECKTLSEISVDADNPAYASVDGILFDKSISTLLCYPEGKAYTESAIPSTVESIDDSTFYNYTSLVNLTLPGSIKSVGKYAFVGCTGLRKVELPRSLSQLGNSAFKNCENLSDLYINYMERVYQVDSRKENWPFEGVKKSSCLLYGPAGLKAGYENSNCWGGFKYKGQYHLIKGVYAQEATPTTRTVSGSCFEDSIPVKDMGFEGHPGITSLNLTSLEPGKENSVVFYATAQVQGNNYYRETKELTFTQPALALITLQPKGVSNTCSLVAATTNISEEETNVGFQWKKNDAPATISPKEGLAAIREGQIEGRINDLQSTSYYDVRAFYKSAAGNYYYGDWVTFDPSDFSYFEPTVHTYAAEDVTESSAKVKGYVLAGTDEITEQGFEYWPAGDGGSKAKRVTAAAPATDGIETVLATGQVMTAELKNLQPGTTYCLRAFVKTTAGTVYGEEQTFTTPGNATGISHAPAEQGAPTVTGCYDMNGRRIDAPRKGINIIRYSDGTARKVIVK